MSTPCYSVVRICYIYCYGNSICDDSMHGFTLMLSGQAAVEEVCRPSSRDEWSTVCSGERKTLRRRR